MTTQMRLIASTPAVPVLLAEHAGVWQVEASILAKYQ